MSENNETVMAMLYKIADKLDKLQISVNHLLKDRRAPDMLQRNDHNIKRDIDDRIKKIREEVESRVRHSRP
jgi:hypothetical protein